MLRIAPTYLRCELTFNVVDYGKKESITIEIRRRSSALQKKHGTITRRLGNGMSNIFYFGII